MTKQSILQAVALGARNSDVHECSLVVSAMMAVADLIYRDGRVPRIHVSGTFFDLGLTSAQGLLVTGLMELLSAALLVPEEGGYYIPGPNLKLIRDTMKRNSEEGANRVVSMVADAIRQAAEKEAAEDLLRSMDEEGAKN